MISVVTITFNNFEELKTSIDSLKGVQGIELVVVNGGSCKKTQAYLESTPYKDGPFRFVSEPDKGIADAFNKGVRLSSGIAVDFLNSGDVLLKKDYFTFCQKIFNENPDIGFVHGAVIFADQMAGKMEMHPRLCSLGRGLPYYHQTMCVKKSVFDEIGAFDLDFKIGMDFDFVCRMEKASIKGYYYKDEPIVLMDGAGVSATQESKSIADCKRALIKNDLWTFKNKWGIFRRYALYSLRTLMLKWGLKDLLITLKRLKNDGKTYR